MADENLTVRLWDAIHDARSTPSGHAPTSAIVAAVLPILAEEARKAKAEAWDEGWKERSRRDIYRSGPLDDARPVPGPPRSLNPYRETGDQA